MFQLFKNVCDKYDLNWKNDLIGQALIKLMINLMLISCNTDVQFSVEDTINNFASASDI